MIGTTPHAPGARNSAPPRIRLQFLPNSSFANKSFRPQLSGDLSGVAEGWKAKQESVAAPKGRRSKAQGISKGLRSKIEDQRSKIEDQRSKIEDQRSKIESGGCTTRSSSTQGATQSLIHLTSHRCRAFSAKPKARVPMILRHTVDSAIFPAHGPILL